MSAERIKDLNMTMQQVIMELSRHDGGGYNPGAMTVCMSILTQGESIDPDCATPFLTLLLLDSFNIYADRVWMLFKDVCGENLEKTIAMLRAVQLRLLPQTDLQHAINNYGRGIDVNSLLMQVKERLPRFGGNGGN